ncbi:MAG: hypothetical protein RBS39_06840 [Phycisphaerales bacterium]|jgi:hypothetical protein|nr:hypothetical protein [Phycisphaerales bacterium]
MTHHTPKGPPPSPRGDFARRIGIYCIGIAIGLLMVGALQRARVAQQQAPPQDAGSITPVSPRDDAPHAPAQDTTPKSDPNPS